MESSHQVQDTLLGKRATLVSTGSLASMNNALIPEGQLVDYTHLGPYGDIMGLTLGGALIIVAVGLSENWFKGLVETRRL